MPLNGQLRLLLYAWLFFLFTKSIFGENYEVYLKNTKNFIGSN